MSIELTEQIDRVRAATFSPSNGAGRPMIELCDLQKVYQLGQDAFVALEKVSLTVMAGEFVRWSGQAAAARARCSTSSPGSSQVERRRSRHGSRSWAERADRDDVPVAGAAAWRTNLDNVLLPIEVFGLDRKRIPAKGTFAAASLSVSRRLRSVIRSSFPAACSNASRSVACCCATRRAR